jgi:hypothetical protein
MTKTRIARAPSKNHNNEDLLIWACFSAGGQHRWMDIEEIFLMAYQLAPSRLGWRTADHIADKLKCAKALQAIEHPTKSKHAGLLLRRGEYVRKLSVKGVEWCRRYETVLSSLYGLRQVPAANTQDSSRTIRQVETSEAFKRFVAAGKLKVERWELAEALGCMSDSAQSVWMARLDRLEAAALANSRRDVSRFVTAARETTDTYFDADGLKST